MKPKILICDDEEGVRESYRLILEKDYDLVFASNGDEGIQAVKKEPVDLVILDIKMPKKSGVDALKEMKVARPNLKVIISTGYRSVEVAQEASRLGATEYLVKPFDSQTIYKLVKRLLFMQ